jgi:rod shape-determining protein MreD
VAPPIRSRTLLGSGASESLFLRGIPVALVIGWFLLAAGEVFAPMGAPAVALAMAVLFGLRLGGEAGFWAGLGVGLTADLLSSLPLGSQAFSAALFGLGMGSLSRLLSPTSRIAPALFLALAAGPYRLLLGLVAELGGRPHFVQGLSQTLALIPWDVGAGVLIDLVLSRWQTTRR